MRALRALVLNNARSFVRDRAAVFWTFAFPILFVILFGSIFSNSGPSSFKVGWVDLDGSPAVAQLHDGFAGIGLLKLTAGTKDASLEQMGKGDLDAVLVVPAGTGQALAGGAAGSAAPPVSLVLYTDPSRQTQSQTISQVVNQMVNSANVAVSGRPPVLALQI